MQFCFTNNEIASAERPWEKLIFMDAVSFYLDAGNLRGWSESGKPALEVVKTQRGAGTKVLAAMRWPQTSAELVRPVGAISKRSLFLDPQISMLASCTLEPLKNIAASFCMDILTPRNPDVDLFHFEAYMYFVKEAHKAVAKLEEKLPANILSKAALKRFQENPETEDAKVIALLQRDMAPLQRKYLQTYILFHKLPRVLNTAKDEGIIEDTVELAGDAESRAGSKKKMESLEDLEKLQGKVAERNYVSSIEDFVDFTRKGGILSDDEKTQIDLQKEQGKWREWVDVDAKGDIREFFFRISPRLLDDKNALTTLVSFFPAAGVNTQQFRENMNRLWELTPEQDEEYASRSADLTAFSLDELKTDRAKLEYRRFVILNLLMEKIPASQMIDTNKLSAETLKLPNATRENEKANETLPYLTFDFEYGVTRVVVDKIVGTLNRFMHDFGISLDEVLASKKTSAPYKNWLALQRQYFCMSIPCRVYKTNLVGLDTPYYLEEQDVCDTPPFELFANHCVASKIRIFTLTHPKPGRVISTFRYAGYIYDSLQMEYRSVRVGDKIEDHVFQDMSFNNNFEEIERRWRQQNKAPNRVDAYEQHMTIFRKQNANGNGRQKVAYLRNKELAPLGNNKQNPGPIRVEVQMFDNAVIEKDDVLFRSNDGDEQGMIVKKDPVAVSGTEFVQLQFARDRSLFDSIKADTFSVYNMWLSTVRNTAESKSGELASCMGLKKSVADQLQKNPPGITALRDTGGKTVLLVEPGQKNKKKPTNNNTGDVQINVQLMNDVTDVQTGEILYFDQNDDKGVKVKKFNAATQSGLSNRIILSYKDYQLLKTRVSALDTQDFVNLLQSNENAWRNSVKSLLGKNAPENTEANSAAIELLNADMAAEQSRLAKLLNRVGSIPGFSRIFTIDELDTRVDRNRMTKVENITKLVYARFIIGQLLWRFDLQDKLVVHDGASYFLPHNERFFKLMSDVCGCCMVTLPSYSPEFNPIELVFGLTKKRVKRADFVRDHMYLKREILLAFDSVRKSVVANFFYHDMYSPNKAVKWDKDSQTIDYNPNFSVKYNTNERQGRIKIFQPNERPVIFLTTPKVVFGMQGQRQLERGKDYVRAEQWPSQEFDDAVRRKGKDPTNFVVFKLKDISDSQKEQIDQLLEVNDKGTKNVRFIKKRRVGRK